MTNIANWKIQYINAGFSGKIIHKWAIYTMAMLNNQRVITKIIGCSKCSKMFKL